MLKKLNHELVQEVIKYDPVRPHISSRWRIQGGREVYGLYSDESLQNLRAVICVAYTDTVPTCEDDMEIEGSEIAVFYTVWSYEKGAGRDIVFAVANHIKKTNNLIKRYVTLSPLTQMATNFHLKNGAKLLKKHAECQNFEYELD